MKLRSTIFFCLAFSFVSAQQSQQNPKITISQPSNGSATSPKSPVEWVKNHLNPVNSHYAENGIIPYRAIVEDVPLDCIIKLRVSFHIAKSDLISTDFFTSYDVDVNHNQVFNHNMEQINPLSGLNGNFIGPSFAFYQFMFDYVTQDGQHTIDNFFSFVADHGIQRMAVWNGRALRIDTLGQTFQGAHVTTGFDVYFIADRLPVVFAWGGHIASQFDYGRDKTARGGQTRIEGISVCTVFPATPDITRPDELSMNNSDDLQGEGQSVTYSLDGGGKPINPIGKPNKESTPAKEITDSLNKIKVFPNPGSGNIYIGIADKLGAVDLILQDLNGKVIKQYNAVQTRTINIERLPRGMYVLRIIVKGEGEIKKKIIFY